MAATKRATPRSSCWRHDRHACVRHVREQLGGAYAIAATLAFMRNQPALLHTPELAAEILQACGRAGGISAKEGYSSGTVDRVPASIHVRIAELLQYMVLAARDELTSR